MVADWTKLLVASTRAERTRDSPHSTSGISRFVTPNLVPAGSARRNNEISSGSRGASSKECDYLLSLPPLPPPPPPPRGNWVNSRSAKSDMRSVARHGDVAAGDLNGNSNPSTRIAAYPSISLIDPRRRLDYANEFFVFFFFLFFFLLA